MQDSTTAYGRQTDEVKDTLGTLENSRASPSKESNGEKDEEKPTGENNFEHVGQPSDEKRSQRQKEPVGESTVDTRKSPGVDKKPRDGKNAANGRPSERPSRFSYSMTRRVPPQAPRASTSPTPSSQDQKASPPTSAEKQNRMRIGNKRADKFKLTGRDRLGGKLSQHGVDETGDSRKQSVGTKQKEKATALRGEKLDDEAIDEPATAFTDPVPKVEQRFSRSRGPSTESTPKREANGAKGTYRAHLMSRAKGRIADELLVQYDVYFEKYRKCSGWTYVLAT